jgi:deoxyribose-phosphate aldolase
MAAPGSYEDLARLIDHSLLERDLTDTHIAEGCALAKRYGVQAVIVRPCDIDIAVRLLADSGVAAGSVCGFPFGDQNTGTKLYEARDLLRRGAKEIDVALNVSKLLGRQFPHIETELLQMAESCHKEGALLKVVFENAYLTDELRTIACRICSRVEADFVSTATGFGPGGYVAADVKVMLANSHEETGIKATGGVDTLDVVLDACAAGCTRIGTAKTAVILDEWKARLAAASQQTQTVPA